MNLILLINYCWSTRIYGFPYIKYLLRCVVIIVVCGKDREGTKGKRDFWEKREISPRDVSVVRAGIRLLFSPNTCPREHLLLATGLYVPDTLPGALSWLWRHRSRCRVVLRPGALRPHLSPSLSHPPHRWLSLDTYVRVRFDLLHGSTEKQVVETRLSVEILVCAVV